MRLAIVGCGHLANHPQVHEIILNTLLLKRPTIVLFPRHVAFNTAVRALGAALSLPVEEIKPPRPTWLGKSPVSVRKRLARGVWGRYLAGQCDSVLAFRSERGDGQTFQPLLDHAKEAVTIRISE